MTSASHGSGAALSFAIVVMGVSGCGKSTIGRSLADRWGCPFLEGDAFHSPANVAKMAAGVPLNDDDRWPWLDSLGQGIASHAPPPERQVAPPPERRGAAPRIVAVVACSALRRVYRDRLREAAGGVALRFLCLDGSRNVLSTRMGGRTGHYMPMSLLDSQIALLEPPERNEDAVILDIAKPVPALVEEAAAWTEWPGAPR